MRHLTFTNASTYPVCFLVPTIRRDEIEKEYLDPFQVNADQVLVLDLHYSQDKKKTPAAEIKQYIKEELVPTFEQMGCQYLLVADGDYFKALTKASKVEANLGYVLDCAWGDWKVIYVPNYRAIFYDPDKTRAKINQAMQAFTEHRTGVYQAPGAHIIKTAHYPATYGDILAWLNQLLDMDCDLACDIETFSLKHHTAGIGTISFAWNQHEGIAFAVDLNEVEAQQIRSALRMFFCTFQHKLVFHNIAFDAYVLIYQLFMTDILDTEGLLNGMEVMLRDWDCTKLITYLATNSCAGNKLSLKDQAQEYSGNYALTDIKDIRQIPLEHLLRYNLIDTLSTWYVHNKHYQTMVDDRQLGVYEEIFKPATLDIIQMQLTGMPLNMERVREVKQLLEADYRRELDRIMNSPIVGRFTYDLNETWVEKRNAKLKKKRVSLADANETFNPNSNPQLQKLLYEMLGLPVLALTDSKEPATDGSTLKALKNHTQDPQIVEFLDALLGYSAVNKILTSFLPAMENAAQGPDGWHYLFGNFNLGGTLSGRLSSSDPNLQNLPANSSYAKLIKSCFQAPPGWLFVGLDFASLEDRISALTSKDPNKLKVYNDGYDGHSLRAYAYFKEQMPDILQAEGRRVFEVQQDGQIFYLFEGDEIITPNGQITTIETYQSRMKQLESAA